MVSIVSACRNEESHIREFLDSLLQQEFKGEGYEIILADGMSTDRTFAIIQEYTHKHPAMRVIQNPGKFVSSGLNAAIRAAKGAIIVRMDAHTIYAPDYVVKCVEALDRTGADNVGGAARTRTTGKMQRAIAAVYHSRFGSGGASFHNTNFEGWADTVTYGCWRRETLERLGMFDETLVRNQDDELNLRLVRSGGRIWQSADIISWYIPRSTLPSLARQYFQYGFWKIAVIKKHRLPARWTHLVPGTLVLGEITLPTLVGLACIAGQFVAAIFLFKIFLLMNALYGCALLLATWQTAKKAGWDLFVLLPITFATYHMSYGYGFLRGIVAFGLLRTSLNCTGGTASELSR